MDLRTDLTYRHALLRAEIRRRLAASRKWQALPGLLDELHRVRMRMRMQCEQGTTAEVPMALSLAHHARH